MSDKTHLIENTLEYFKQRGLIASGDISLIGIEILNPTAIFHNAKNYAWYVMVTNRAEIRLYSIDNITHEYKGDFVSIPLNTITKAKTKRTSVFFGEQYFVIKYSGHIQVNTPDKIYNLNQTQNVQKMVDFFNNNF
jgi:hypothetical protein